jgi:DNA-directed RNA polymerase specialized sigma24 family protein
MGWLVRSGVLIWRNIVDETEPAEAVPKPFRHLPALAMGEPAGSVTRWLGDLKAGNPQAFQPLWDRYYATLVERARAKLRALRIATPAHDEEDVASSAFHSLYQGIREGRFPRLDDRDDLWRLLVHLSACKALDQRRAESRQKRGCGKVFTETDLIAASVGFGAEDEDQDQPYALDQIIGSEPSPEFAAMVSEEYVRRLDELSDAKLRRIAELKLACYRNEEIRQQLGCSLRSVTLRLELIRKKWARLINETTEEPIATQRLPGGTP